MKQARFYDIHIQKPGDVNEPFDPFEYLESLINQRHLNGIFFRDGTMLTVSSSWNEARYWSVAAHCLRQGLRIYGRRFLDLLHGFLWKAATSKTDRAI